jgi:hypothetical protein
VLRKTTSGNTRVETVYACGKEITDTIENVQDNLQINCCGNYAIISTGKWSMKYDIGSDEAFLVDGTRCIPDKREMDGETEYLATWITDDEHQWELPNPYLKDRDTNLVGYISAHLPFRCNIDNTRWAALYQCDKQIIEDKRLTSIECLQCGEDTFAMCPIMDDMDFQQWHLFASYSFSDEECSSWGDVWFSRWIHNPQKARDRRPPNLTEADKDRLATWLDAFPMMGIYVALNGKLVSMNPGAEANGGHDIQEKMPPEDMPSGKYWYINDRNAPVRFDKQIEETDQAWNHNCSNTRITLSAQSLNDLHAAPAVQCQPKKARYGVEGTGRGRVVLGGNGVLAVFDSDLGRMDFSASSPVCRLR